MKNTCVNKRNKKLCDGIKLIYDELSRRKVIKSEDTSNQSYHFEKIVKVDDEKHNVFGWIVWSRDREGNVEIDSQDDVITPEDLEELSYRYVHEYGDLGQMHETLGDGYCIASLVFTEDIQNALCIPKGLLPIGWYAGFHIINEDAWKEIKNGTYGAFSIEGNATRTEIEV